MVEDTEDFDFLDVAKILSPEFFECVGADTEEMRERLSRQGWQGGLPVLEGITGFQQARNLIHIALEKTVAGGVISPDFIRTVPLFVLPNDGVEVNI